MKNIIFDLGAVMFDWNPKNIAKQFTADEKLQLRIQDELFYHKNWMDFDCGLVTESEAITIASKQLEISLVEAKRLFELVKTSLVLLPKTEQVLKDVKEKNLKAYCLSNISETLFNHLAERHDLFELFDGIVTSGVENIAKPDRAIFEILFSRFDLNPKECFFIDDSSANTATANELGVATVTFKGTAGCYQQIYTYI